MEKTRIIRLEPRRHIKEINDILLQTKEVYKMNYFLFDNIYLNVYFPER